MTNSGLRRAVWAMLGALAAAAVGLTGAAPARAAADEDAVEILTRASSWRWYAAVQKPTVSVEALKAAGKEATEPAVLPVKVPWREVPGVEKVETGPPPDGWRDVSFDDADWPRAQGPFDTNLQVALLCLRGRFVVTDPAAVKGLSLSLAYRGGAVVYLNGTEVARTGLPAGDLTPFSPAQAYPDEAFLTAAGAVLPTERNAKGEDLERIGKRERRLGGVELPRAALRKGINVLAVEIHRSPFHPIALTWWATSEYLYSRGVHWSPVGLPDIRLTAVGAGVQPNILRPAGVHVWHADIHQRISLDDFGDPREGVQPLTLVGARNGTYSASFVVSSDTALAGVSAEVGDLTSDGGARIPASAVEVRYAVEGNQETGLTWFFDALASQSPGDRPPTRRHDYRMDRRRRDLGMPDPLDSAIQPVWITVHVPRDAAPGHYRGQVRVSGGGLEGPIALPLVLHVSDWTLSEPRDLRTHVGLFQSPTTLALHYKVPEWSERHWALMEKSFELLGRVGTNLVNVPISDRTQFGNDEGMVYFIRRDDGTFDYDFTVFERYLDLAKRHLGVPTFVALQVWHAGAWRPRAADQENTVTVVDPKTGARTAMQVPVFGTDEAKRFWKPVLAAAKERLAKRGMDEAMCIGILSDGTAPPEVFRMFDEIWPGGGPAKWTRGCHQVTRAPEPYGLPGGGQVVYHEYCYGGGILDPDKRLPQIWKITGPGTDWRRGYRDTFAPVTFRRMPERSLYAETRGIGRLCLDYWSLEFKNPAGRVTRQDLFNRWPHSTVSGHGHPTIFALAHPGPDGPIATTRLELLREGLQEAEAMICVAEALEKNADALGPDLAAVCRRLFLERIQTCRMIEAVEPEFFAGWQDRSRALYEAAAKVAAAVRDVP